MLLVRKTSSHPFFRLTPLFRLHTDKLFDQALKLFVLCIKINHLSIGTPTSRSKGPRLHATHLWAGRPLTSAETSTRERENSATGHFAFLEFSNAAVLLFAHNPCKMHGIPRIFVDCSFRKQHRSKTIPMRPGYSRLTNLPYPPTHDPQSARPAEQQFTRAIKIATPPPAFLHTGENRDLRARLL